MVYGRFFHYIALATAGNLALIALRDFLEAGPLWLRYLAAAAWQIDAEEQYLASLRSISLRETVGWPR